MPVLCMEHLQGFTPELKPVFLNAACQQDLQQETGALSQPSPCSRMETPFPPYLKLTFSFPYAEKREQIRFDVRVSRERVFLSSFCHKKRREMSSSSQGQLARCFPGSLGSEDGSEPSAPKALTSFRKQAVGAEEMQQVETMERKVLVEPRSTGRGAWL